MECKHCGKPIVDGATFCGYCGKRVDGKRPCSACGYLNAEDYAFCVSCGKRIDGKTECPNCGTVYEGNFCPTCGQGVKKPKAAPMSATNGSSKMKLNKLFDIISGAAMMLGVLLALVFVCLIGIKETVLVSGDKVSHNSGLFYFFGNYYKDLNEVDFADSGMTGWFADICEGMGTVAGIFGTLISAAIIIAVVTFAVIAIVKYIRSWTGKTENKSFGAALGCMISFIVGAVVFYAYNYDHGDLSATMDAKMTFNGATLVALILIGVCIAIGVAMRLVSAGKTPWIKRNLGKTVCSLVGVLLVSVLVILAQNVGFGFSAEIGGEKATGKGGFMIANFGINVGFGALFNDSSIEGYARLTVLLNTMNVYNVIAQILFFAFLVFVAFSLYASLKNLDGNKKSGLLWAIFSVATAAVLFVFTLLAEGQLGLIYKHMVENLSGIATEINYHSHVGIGIATIVISVLTLACAIVRSCFVKEKKAEEIAAE